MHRERRLRDVHLLGGTEAPPVLADALAMFDCRVVETHAYFTHTLFLARPPAVKLAPGAPLLHYNRGFYGL